MSNFRLNLPVDIPWKLIDCSEDMIDTDFCDKKMPNPFRSSIALFAYEPIVDDLPEEMCEKSLIFLKVSCSITGFQPDTEMQFIYDLDKYGIKEDDINKLIREFYFACYGVLLNISVFNDKDSVLESYPHIVDFEPKTRDFYQSASEFGEILSGSNNSISTNKSYGTTFSTEKGWNQSSTTNEKNDDGSDSTTTSDYGKTSISDKFDQSIQIQNSQDRRETQSTNTQLNQMYNLLNSYHLGTNRATFLMLPRPHLLQPTDRRTFADGLRKIEGIQDFILIVEKNKSEKILRVEINLETGHFPENIDEVPVNPDDKVDDEEELREASYTFKTSGGLFGWNGTVQISPSIQVADEGYEIIASSFEIISHELEGGISENDIKESNLWADKELIALSGQININVISGYYSVEKGWGATEGTITDKYRVKVRKVKKQNIDTKANPEGLLITSRRLCTALEFNERCIKKIKIPYELHFPQDPTIVDEPYFPNNLKPGNNGFHSATINKIKNILFQSKHNPRRYLNGGIGFLQSKYFQKKLLGILPEKILNNSIHEIDFINPKVKEKKLSKDISLKELLSGNDFEIKEKFGINKTELLNYEKPVVKKPGVEKPDIIKKPDNT